MDNIFFVPGVGIENEGGLVSIRNLVLSIILTLHLIYDYSFIMLNFKLYYIEPPTGFEPMTRGYKARILPTELWRQFINILYHARIKELIPNWNHSGRAHSIINR